MSRATKQPKTIEVKVLIPYFILATLTTLIIGIILGYFSGIELHGNARATVMQDVIEVTQATVKK